MILISIYESIIFCLVVCINIASAASMQQWSLEHTSDYLTAVAFLLQEVGMSWRIDKDESGTLNTRMRGSLMALAGSNRRSARLRALLVDLQARYRIYLQSCGL